MNKNTRRRRDQALRNYRVDGQGSTEFPIPVMRPGGYTMGTTTVRIGFVKPKEKKPKRTTVTATTILDTELRESSDEARALAEGLDRLAGKPKALPPLKEAAPDRPVRPAKPLGKINI